MKKINKTKSSVTVGIPAINEEVNIGQLLLSILSQTQNGYKIEKIIVVSDGSTDKTVKIARSIKDSKIKVIDGKTNLGRVFRRNQIMKLANSDILVFLDADGILENNQSLEELVKEFNKSRKIAVVGGNPFSIGENNFLTHSLTIPRDTYTRIRYQINQGHNIFGCMGGMLAIKKILYKQIEIPIDITADDSFIYLSCLKLGFEFHNAKNAKIIHRFPKTLAAHIKRNSRHTKSVSVLKKYFGAEMVNSEFFIPGNLFLKESLKELKSHPLHSVFISLVNSYSRSLPKHN